MSSENSTSIGLKALSGLILGFCAFLGGIASMISGLPVILLFILISVALSISFSVWEWRQLNCHGTGRRPMPGASWWGIGFGILGILMGTILTPIG